MNSETSLEREQKYAKQQVDRFVRRFEPSYRKLAYHAALPLVLTPELLNYLRNQFLREEKVPWVAEVDLLLSDLCRPVGYEQYAMEPAVRAYLMEEMEQVLGKEQMEAVARLLIGYIKHLSQTNPYISNQELKIQQWAAMVCLDDRRQEAVGQISKAYRDCIEAAESGGNPLLSLAEMETLSRITQELAPQLKDYPTLLAYAELVRRLDADPTQVSDELLNRSFRVEDVELWLPSALIPSREDASLSTSQSPIWNFFEFEVATISFEAEIDSSPDIDWQPFEFEVATIRQSKNFIEVIEQSVFAQTGGSFNEIEKSILKGALNKKTYKEIAISTNHSSTYVINIATKLWELLSELLGTKVTKTNLKNLFNEADFIISRTTQQAWGFTEDLGNDVQLEMVAIPEGSFMMGSPENEEGHNTSESPQHKVTLKAFCMGKYPVTQAQWETVAALPQVNIALDSNSSNFKGKNLPVERISWLDAVEFCARLCRYTGKSYRLPSEAEWEYACRAGTTTPFHFGETITTDLANYDGNYTYGAGSKVVYRKETTPVGSFGVANVFGLYDMHGNVWEWCADPWHDSYEGAPTDGSVWDENNNDNSYHNYIELSVNIRNNNRTRLLRGGSSRNLPGYCRSAIRNGYVAPDDRDSNIGFRLVCAIALTP